MNKEYKKIKSFMDLDVWQKGHKVVLLIYALTRDFPKEELFCLVSQMRRCVISITSNIAEGFSRFSYKDKIRFYYMAQGSVTELQNQLLIARDIKYVDNDNFSKIVEEFIDIHKMINGLIKKSKEFYS